MSFLSRLFGGSDSPSPSGPQDLESRLAAFEAEFEAAQHGMKGTPLNRAGDLALKHGDAARAMRYYGRAIDTYLQDQQLEAARGVANKIIRVHPKAVRTLCTLTWLDLAARHMATALLHLRDYVEAAKRTHHEDIAAEQIYRMAEVAPLVEFLSAAADALDRLDRADRAAEVRGWVTEEGSPLVIRDEHELAERCMAAATEVASIPSSEDPRAS